MRQCPQCNYQDDGAVFCPQCGSRMLECCPRCGRAIPGGSTQCPFCIGSGGLGVPGAGLNLGDIGMVKGSINVTNSTSIGTQNNYQGPVSIHVDNTSRALTAGECLANGQNALQTCQYPMAVEHFQRSLVLDGGSPLVYYYLALAALHGCRPRLLKLVEIQKIQSHLRTALQMDANCAPARYLWAIIIEDYYVLNRMYFPPNTPQPEDIIRPVRSIPSVHAREMIHHISAPDNQIWQALCTFLHTD